MGQKMKSVLGLTLAAALIFGGAPAAASAAGSGPAPSPEKIGADVSKVLAEKIPKGGLRIGTSEGEWTAIALARAGYDDPAAFDTYCGNVAEEVVNDRGLLSKNKDTEYSRVILGLTAVGRNPRNVEGYDLVQPLADYDKVVLQGISGPVWALIALDSRKYDMPTLKGTGGTQNSRDKMVDYILANEIGAGTASAGGWAFVGTDPDPDITAMALQALSDYRSRADVQAAVERGLNVLSRLQGADGGYASWGAENSESTAQVILALTELGISPDRADFVKNGHTLISALAGYYLPGQGFKDLPGDASSNAMATDQCALAVAACNRFQSDRNAIYDMTDVAPVNRAYYTPAFASDTNSDLTVNGAYTFKITGKNGKAPNLVVGTPGVFDVKFVKRAGNDSYVKITAVGAPGARAGIYINGGLRLLVATVGSNPSYVRSDTTGSFQVKAGKSYVVKLTADAKPNFTAGTGSAFQVCFVKQSGRDYFFRVTAVGKAGQASGFYINRQARTAVATIVK